MCWRDNVGRDVRCLFGKRSGRGLYEFMLATIKASLIDAIKMSDGTSDGRAEKTTLRWR